jgi:hypothetical protein
MKQLRKYRFLKSPKTRLKCWNLYICIRRALFLSIYAFVPFVELHWEIRFLFLVVATTVTDHANARYPRLNRRLLLGLQHR